MMYWWIKVCLVLRIEMDMAWKDTLFVVTRC